MTADGTVIDAKTFGRQWEEIGRDVVDAVEAVGRSGWYILGNEVRGFEQALSQKLDGQAVVGCANGLDAIELGLRALGLTPGDRVLTTPLSAFATTLAIVRAGGKPVFVDVDELGLLDLDKAAQAIERGNIRFMVPVHLFGNTVNLARLRQLRDRFDLRVVEDAAQAVGAKSAGMMVGSAGQVTTYSFYPTKNLGALGDGGALSTRDANIESAVRSLRDYGQRSKYAHEDLGLNSRLDELHAAILKRAFLPRMDAWQLKRNTFAQRYLAAIRNPAVRCLGASFDPGCVWHLFPVCVDAAHRDALLGYLRAAGVQVGVHYPGIIPDQRAMEKVPGGFEVIGSMDRARALTNTEVSLPLSPHLSAQEIDRVAELVNDWRP